MTSRLPSLNALRALEAAARHRSFARAAAELHVTPAAVSQLIKQLEQTLNVMLFKRGKTLELSDAASKTMPLFSEAFDRLELAVNLLRGGNTPGPLVLSTPPTFAARWLIPRLEDFQAQHPEIELRLLATRRMVDFNVEDIDLALRFGIGPFPGLHADRLMSEMIVPIAAPVLADKIEKPSDLASCTLLHDESNDWDPAFPRWDTLLASLGVRTTQAPRIRHFGDANLVIQAAVAGLGVGLAWQSLVTDELRAGRLVRILNESVATKSAYHLVVPLSRLHVGKVAAFRSWILEQAKR